MCGIAGYQGNFASGLLDRMGRAVAHRGPDGEGAVLLSTPYAGVTTGLAHRRLAIIDLSPNGKQPMTVRCPRCRASSLQELALTYNGELYNYRELRAQLQSKGHVFHSETDSEVLIHLYAEHGTEMLPKLNGIFAFALHDGREHGRPTNIERGDLLLVRDPLGVKPLYVASTPRGVLFASELKSIVQCPDVSRSVDPVALHYHLAYLWTPAPRTLLQGVEKLEPGCAIVARQGAVARRWQWCELPYDGDRLTDPPEAIAVELRERVAAAVERQLVADVPVGAFLSGGLDSSAIVAMARRNGGTPTQCYTIAVNEDGMLEGTPNDLPYAKRVASALGVPLQTIDAGPDIIEHLDEMLFFLDEPQADPAPINALLIARQARTDGIPVLLSGAGGDDIFSGYRRHFALRMERFWSWLPHAARAGIARSARSMAEGRSAVAQSQHVIRRAVKSFSHADHEDDERLASYFWWSTDGVRRALYSDDLAAATVGTRTAAPLLASLDRIPNETDALQRMLFLETKFFLADHNLNYTDKMGMAAGVEVRVPLLDLELVQFAARIPPSLKQQGRTGKAIFKQAMQGVLPQDVIHRGKTGFGAPLRRWLRSELRERVDETLSVESLRARGLFAPSAVRRLIDLDRAGHIDGGYTIFALMCVELWCRQFVDAVPSPIGSFAATPAA
ncbi:MAG TPA: asparagine synthase (glutamine-hydrolyzing) [Gemmatimonadaceae bacterium]